MRIPVQAVLMVVILALFSQISFSQNVTQEPQSITSNPVQRVAREHATSPAPGLEFLTNKIVKDEPYLTAEAAAQDLDQLEWLLENRYVGRKQEGMNYQSLLDTIRIGLGEKISVKQLGLELQKFLVLLKVHGCHLEPLFQVLPDGYLAFFPVESGGRVYAVNDERRRLAVNSYPYIKSLDSVPFSQWQSVAEKFIPDTGDPLLRQLVTTRIKYLRAELGLKNSRWIQMELTNDKEKSLVLKTPLMPTPSKGKPWPRRESGILEGKILYLRIAEMTPEPEIADGLEALLEESSETEGLIIDLRNSQGKSTLVMRRLLPWFVPWEEGPKVVALGVWSHDQEEKAIAARGFFPLEWSGWSGTEKATVDSARSAFPEAKLPDPDKFAPLNFLVCSPGQTEGKRYHKPVVILMNAATSEAASFFIYSLKGMEGVTLLGENSQPVLAPTGIFKLENSELEISLTRGIYFAADGGEISGQVVAPDVRHQGLIGDYIGKSDSMLDKALKILKEKKGQ